MTSEQTQTALPSCYGREWDPTDENVCGRCAVEPQCVHLFANEGLDLAAKALQIPSPQAATAEKLAEWCGTSVEAINQARAKRFDPASRASAAAIRAAQPVSGSPPAEPGSAEPAPKPPTPEQTPSPSPDSPLESTSSEEPAKSQKKSRSKKSGSKTGKSTKTTDKAKKTKAKDEGLPSVGSEEPVSAEQPEEDDGVGFVLNLTTGSTEHASWPGFPPLFQTPGGGAPILQVVYWSQALGKWVWLVSEGTGRDVPDGVVELTWRQLMEAGYEEKLGTDPTVALRRVVAPRE